MTAGCFGTKIAIILSINGIMIEFYSKCNF